MTLTQDAVAGLVERFKHFDWCPICRGGLDTGLECEKCGADWMPLQRALEQQAARIAELENALKEAIYCVREWHNLPYTRQEASKQWDIYWRNSPEMARLRAALSAKEQ